MRRRVQELRTTGERTREDRLVTEEPLEVRLAWPGSPARRVWVTMRTPGHDFELAAGWVRHEGLVDDTHGAVAGVAYCTDADLTEEQAYNTVTVTLAAPPLRDLAHRHEASSAGSSACGVCGADSLADALSVAAPGGWSGALPTPEVVRSLPDRLRAAQAVFDRTGGSHAAALCTADGEMLVVREDVGRHNAVDKVAGARVLAGLQAPARRAALEDPARVVGGRLWEAHPPMTARSSGGHNRRSGSGSATLPLPRVSLLV